MRPSIKQHTGFGLLAHPQYLFYADKRTPNPLLCAFSDLRITRPGMTGLRVNTRVEGVQKEARYPECR